MTYFIELPGKWPRSRKRILEIVGWAIAQPRDDKPDEELWFSGGGPVRTGVPWVRDEEEVYCSLGSHYGIYKGETPKFVMNNHYAAVFRDRSRVEEVAVLLAVQEPSLMGRLYIAGVTRLGPVSKKAVLCQKSRNG